MQDEVVFDLFKKMVKIHYKLKKEQVEERFPSLIDFLDRDSETEQERIEGIKSKLNDYGTDFVYQALNSGIKKQDEMVDVLSNAYTGLGYFTMIVDDIPVLGIISDALSISVNS